MILLITIVIFILVIILYCKETFITNNSDILDYLKKNVDNKVNNYLCFNNNDLLKLTLNDTTATCESVYPSVSDINVKQYEYEGQRYSFNDLCPNTTKQNSLLCTKKHNNEIQALNSQLNKLISEVSYSYDNKLFELDNEIQTYRNDKFRLYNTSPVSRFMNYYKYNIDKYDNTELLQKIKGPNATCNSEYSNVDDVNVKSYSTDNKSYSFNDICPVTVGEQLLKQIKGDDVSCMSEISRVRDINKKMYTLNNQQYSFNDLCPATRK